MVKSALHLERVLDRLALLCQTDLGRSRAEQLQPAGNPAEAEARLDRLSACDLLLQHGLRITLPEGLDVSALTQRATRGMSLDGSELVAVWHVARTTTRLRREARNWPAGSWLVRDVVTELPALDLLAQLLGDALEDDGRLKDDASPELAKLRHEVVALAARLRRRIAEMVKEADDDGILQDEYYTLRDDRYVLPVKSSDKRVLGGIIHGTSQTGQTVYVEPQEMVEGNNQLALAYEAVRREERRILAQLSAMCAEEAEPLLAAVVALAALDLWQAAALLSAELRGVRPEFSQDGRLHLRATRHPLLVLDGVPVVHNDVELPTGSRWLVISGPNGGGKTVVLTSLGLAVEMARLGLYVCAGEGATLPWFDAVEVVLGDAQDIERGLSTFDGHVRAVSHALEAAREHPERALVLLDELAGGTEPLAGAALATALLETFGALGTWGAVTTHFESLKLLPLRDPRFQNAALQLDASTMAPNFRLRLGEFGSSNPLALAARVGLDPAVVERARELASGAGGEAAILVERLRAERALVHKQLAEMEQQHLQLDRQRVQLEELRQREKQETDRRVDKAVTAALAELADVQRLLDEARRAMRAEDREAIMAAQKTATHKQTELQRMQRQSAQPVGPARKAWAPDTQRPDGLAWHTGLQRVVQVLDVDTARQKVRIQAGILASTAKYEELRQILATEAPRPKQAYQPDRQIVAQTVSEPVDDDTVALRTPDRTVDLRGMRVEEGLETLEAALSRAIVSRVPGLCIVHGMGTGAMRDAVRQALRKNRQIGRWRPGRQGEGGDGASFCWFAGD